MSWRVSSVVNTSAAFFRCQNYKGSLHQLFQLHVNLNQVSLEVDEFENLSCAKKFAWNELFEGFQLFRSFKDDHKVLNLTRFLFNQLAKRNIEAVVYPYDSYQLVLHFILSKRREVHNENIREVSTEVFDQLRRCSSTQGNYFPPSIHKSWPVLELNFPFWKLTDVERVCPEHLVNLVIDHCELWRRLKCEEFLKRNVFYEWSRCLEGILSLACKEWIQADN
mmetsp:Transcript_20010/g.14720  ORF Transcript_20010/g.14720 Transcript_20010/m.14720 type:complete len:222 (-) Transcript_20010:652-1317(-)